jgi:formylglycine-generating enzyme
MRRRGAARRKSVNTARIWVSVCALLGLLAGTALAVNIETVPVGNAGNTGEPSGGGSFLRTCGAVAYAYNIAKFEVTAGQYTAFLNAVAKTDSYGLYSTNMDYDANPSVYGCNIKRTGSPGSYGYSVAPDWADRPVGHVSWGDAARFCNWLHNGQPTGAQSTSTTENGSYYLNGATGNDALLAVTRQPNATWVIPSEDEWYKAAYHRNDGVTGNYWDYATRSNSSPSNDLIDPDPGDNANFFQAGYTIGAPYYRTEVGEFENSESPYGTFDQGGNVSEWNEGVIGSLRGLRGGSAYTDPESMLRAATRYYANYPTTEGHNMGFRVAYVPEPGTLMLLALGALTLTRRRPRE